MDDARHHQEQHTSGTAHSGNDPGPVDAAHQHQHRTGAQNQHRAGQVGLQHHQHRDNTHDQQIGRHAVPGGVHLVFLLGNIVRKVNDHRQLGDLRGLEGEQLAHAQPAGGVVAGHGDGVAGDDDQHQQNDGKVQHQLGSAPEPLVVDPADQEHGRDAHGGKDALAYKVVHGVLAVGLIIGGGEAGGQQQHQSDGCQQQHQQAEGQINGTLGQFPALGFFFLPPLDPFPAGLLGLLLPPLPLLVAIHSRLPLGGRHTPLGCHLHPSSPQNSNQINTVPARPSKPARSTPG